MAEANGQHPQMHLSLAFSIVNSQVYLKLKIAFAWNLCQHFAANTWTAVGSTLLKSFVCPVCPIGVANAKPLVSRNKVFP